MKKINLNNKIILITGFTGSLGTALVKILLNNKKIKEIRGYARDEYKISELMRKTKDKRLIPYIGDIRNLDRLRDCCKNVDIIFHVAALKRMDVSSENTFEVADINILGTRNVMIAGSKCERIVVVSTDKAATCKNVYGASKFIAENVALAYKNSVVWRFGNIIGSRGSVWEIFKEQKEMGVPFTITEPNSTRFVIDVKEVCDCLLSNVKHGLFWPKHLKSMTIKQIADSISPNHPCKIIGLRENETLHEKFTDEYSSDKCLIK